MAKIDLIMAAVLVAATMCLSACGEGKDADTTTTASSDSAVQSASTAQKAASADGSSSRGGEGSASEESDAGTRQQDSADVNGSGEIEITDATLIQMWLAEVETPYSIGEQPTEAPTQMPTDADGWGRIVFRP